MNRDNNIPIVNMIEAETHVHEECYIYNGRRYSTANLIDISKGLPIFKVPLVAFSTSYMPWTVDSIDDIIFHMIRVENTDLKYPIILDTFGNIANGWHRVMKAIMLKKKTIKAVRLVCMPPYTEESND